MINWRHVPDVWVDENRCGGRPCIRGRRFTVSQLVATLAETDGGVKEMCGDYGFDEAQVRRILIDIAKQLDV